MAYTTLINDIKAVIKNNGNQEITGQVLQTALVEMVNELGSGYTYKGVATLSTTPDVTTPNIFYLLGEAGTYANMSSSIVHTSGIGIALWNGTAWSYQNVPSSAVVATDATPTKNSTKPVQSGGVETYLAHKSIEYSPSPMTTGAMRSTGVIDTTASTYRCYSPIELKNGETILMNKGNAFFRPANTVVLWKCSESGTYIEYIVAPTTSGTSRAESFTNDTGSTIYVGICAQRLNMPYIIKSLANAVGEEDLTSAISASEASMTDKIDGIESEYLIGEPLKSIHYDNQTYNNWDGGSPRWFVNMSRNNNEYKDVHILGMKLYCSAVGSVSIIKGENVFSNSTTYTYTTLQTFDVVVGENILMLTNPVMLTGLDLIGISLSSGVNIRVYTDYSSETNVASFYIGSNDKIAFTSKDMVVAIICGTIYDAPTIAKGLYDADKRLTALETSQTSMATELSADKKMLFSDFLNYPYYYHWNPNGFTDGIPSQSFEDNFLAKRLGFKFVEANTNETATSGKYVITHGSSGTFGIEFTDDYKDVLISSMSYDNIVANVKYNSEKECYNHTISTAESFFKNCAQLGLGVYLRTNAPALVELARTYIPDYHLVIPGYSIIRQDIGFNGVLTAYLTGDSATICNADYLRNYVNTHGGAPFHIGLDTSKIDYMVEQGTLETIVKSLRSDWIFIGGSYGSTSTLEKLTAIGGLGHAASLGQCNPIVQANFGSWSPLDQDLSEWTIPSGITISGGRIVNATNESLEVKTPSTQVLPLAIGQVQARVKGSCYFSLGERLLLDYLNYNEDVPINLNVAGIKKNMQLRIKIEPNSSVEFLNYQVCRC